MKAALILFNAEDSGGSASLAREHLFYFCNRVFFFFFEAAMCKEKGIYILSFIFSFFFLNFLPFIFSHTLEWKLNGLQFGTYAFIKNNAVCSCRAHDSFHKSVIFFPLICF